MTTGSSGASVQSLPQEGATTTGLSKQERVVRLARSAGLTVAVAESLTAGLVSARLADVPGASTVLRGGVVAYATDLKTSMLDVPAALVTAHGPVDSDVAVAMTTGVRARLRADIGVATTGVAGPDPQEGIPPGVVYVAASWPGGSTVRRLRLEGDRTQVRTAAAEAALELLVDLLTHVLASA